MRTSVLRCALMLAAALISSTVLAAALPLAAAQAPAAASARVGSMPQGRVWASWAYDPPHRNVVLFGGDRGYQHSGPDIVLGKTWIWNGRTWTLQHPAASPSPRTGAAMVYDAASGQLLLFGGSRRPFTSGGYLADTWVWESTTWVQLHPLTSPPARHNAGLAYDSARHQVIMFGGYNGHYLNDTWAWNGSTWTQLHPATSPPPRDTHSLVYDPATKTTILFGGYNGVRLADTWAWDGTTWTQLHPATSPGVVSTAWQAAYDTASHQLILFGGDADGLFSNATWMWNGTTWTQLIPPARPGRRAYGSLTYDGVLHRLVLSAGSSGHTDLTTIWEWNGTTWQRH
jgi:Galactose oxidase, central domain